MFSKMARSGELASHAELALLSPSYYTVMKLKLHEIVS